MFFYFRFTLCRLVFFFFFFNDTATTEIYTLSLHDALPICSSSSTPPRCSSSTALPSTRSRSTFARFGMMASSRTSKPRSEEHTSELQSPCNLVCRLLLEKKKKNTRPAYINTTSKRHSPYTL